MLVDESACAFVCCGASFGADVRRVRRECELVVRMEHEDKKHFDPEFTIGLSAQKRGSMSHDHANTQKAGKEETHIHSGENNLHAISLIFVSTLLLSSAIM